MFDIVSIDIGQFRFTLVLVADKDDVVLEMRDAVFDNDESLGRR